MNASLIYLIEVSLCLLVLYSFYWLLLRNLSFYHLRRYFLVFSVIVSFTIPSLDIELSVYKSRVFTLEWPKNTEENTEVYEVKSTETDFPSIVNRNSETPKREYADANRFSAIMSSIYFIGLIFMAIKLTIGVVHLIKFTENTPQNFLNGVKVYHHQHASPAFSFLNHIFINPKILRSEDEKKVALEHEFTHVKERHYFDILLIEVARVTLWFNPIIYMLRNELKIVHEYIADSSCYRISGKKFYSDMLLRHSSVDRANWLILSFAFLPLRKRVSEIFREKSDKRSLFRIIFCLPLLFLLVLNFGCSKEVGYEKSLHFDGKKIKSIKVKYHDEYGDMLRYDGQYYSWAFFDQSGKITDLKKGTDQKSEAYLLHKNKETYPFVVQDHLIWFLDYHSYFEHTIPFFQSPNFYAHKQLNWAQEISKRFYTADITTNDKGLPLKIIIRQNNFFNEDAINISKEYFQYDDKGNMIQSTFSSRTKFHGDLTIDERIINVGYNSIGKIERMLIDDLTYEIYYSESGNISEIIIKGDDEIRYEYIYDESGFRIRFSTKSLAYNIYGELEYTLQYEYKFY
jgi:hypothetical protein